MSVLFATNYSLPGHLNLLMFFIFREIKVTMENSVGVAFYVLQQNQSCIGFLGICLGWFYINTFCFGLNHHGFKTS
jgi:hypothetical protein